MTFRTIARRGHNFFSPNRTYDERIISIEPSFLIQWLKMNEASGTLLDSSGNGCNATATGIVYADSTFLNDNPVPYWDGTQGIVNAYSTTLRDLYTHGEITWLIWCKVAEANDWVDGVFNYAGRLRLGSSSNNQIELYNASTNNQFRGNWVAGGISELITKTGLSTLDWFPIAITASVANNRVRFYFNGDLVSETSSLGTPANTLSDFSIGASVSSLFWHGWLCYSIMWKKELTSSEIRDISTFPNE